MKTPEREKDTGLTYREALSAASARLRDAGVETPRLDAEVLLANALGLDRIQIYLHMDDRGLSAERLFDFERSVAARARRIPVAYILKEKEFFGLSFFVEKGVLIPRPDTETVVEEGLEILSALPKEKIRVLDLCAGSGCIGISLKKTFEESPHPSPKKIELTLSDIEDAPLRACRTNLERLQVEGRVVQGDLFDALEGERFDLIISNPPYIEEGEIERLAPEIRIHEPRTALSGGGDGYDLYKRLISQAGEHLLPGGAIVLEAGFGQSEKLMALLEENGFSRAGAREDLSGIPRAVFAFFTGS